MTADFTLFFGIGAQKAGTSWLYDYLRGHPDVLCPVVKETHYFDHKYRPAPDVKMKYWADELHRLRRKYPFAWGRRRERYRQMIEFYKFKTISIDNNSIANQRYLDYLTRDRAQQQVVADITPGYSVLNRDQLAEMATLVPRTKFLFLMRDPVDRFWSAARMRARWQGASDKSLRDALGIFDLEVSSAGPRFPSRSNYRRSVTELEEAVPEQDRLILFYETLFKEDLTDRITDFLGIATHPANVDRKVHEGEPFKLGDERIARGVRYLAGQYEFVFERFGDRVPQKWRRRYEMLGETATAESA